MTHRFAVALWVALASLASVASLGCAAPVARVAPEPATASHASPGDIPFAEVLASSAVELGGASVDTAAWETLARAIGDARVVMLGEAWHGDGGAIRMRGDLVRWLHERMGFDVLIWEADFYSVDRGWREARAHGGAPRMAADNIYRFWSTSAAALPLWDYVEQRRTSDRPLEIAGVDPRHVGRLARATLPAEMGPRIARLPLIAPEVRTRWLAALERLLADERGSRPTPAEEREFLAVLDVLERDLADREDEDPFWSQEARNLRNLALYAWRNASRDRAMGENLAWLANVRYPDRKLIVWAHNNHILTDKWAFFEAPDSALRAMVGQQPEASRSRATYLGHEARALFGSRLYSIATLSYEGTYSGVPTVVAALTGAPAPTDSASLLAPAPAGTVEERLAARGFSTAFVDLRKYEHGEHTASARVLDLAFVPPTTLHLQRGWDALLVQRQTFFLEGSPSAGWGLALPGR